MNEIEKVVRRLLRCKSAERSSEKTFRPELTWFVKKTRRNASYDADKPRFVDKPPL